MLDCSQVSIENINVFSTQNDSIVDIPYSKSLDSPTFLA